jgi:Primase C terminal 2 (PriCT-2)/Bifunctional DNA primase/polymerase, N-terminal
VGRPARDADGATASGGRHIYLRGSSRNSVCKLGLGLDVRSAGGYVVAPGSRLDGCGEYRWQTDAPLAEAPGWLVEAASERRRPDYPAEAGAGNVSPAHLGLILAELDPSDYREHDPWLELTMACHHATAGDDREEFVEWSTGDPPFADHGHEIRYRWDSLSVDPAGRRPVTERTLFAPLPGLAGGVPARPRSEGVAPSRATAVSAAMIAAGLSPRRRLGQCHVIRPTLLVVAGREEVGPPNRSADTKR